MSDETVDPNVVSIDSKKSAVQIEAEGTLTIQVEFKGISYTFPSDLDNADGDVIDAIDDRKFSHTLKGLLSLEDWVKFKKTKPKVKEYGEFFDAYMKVAGHDSAGN